MTGEQFIIVGGFAIAGLAILNLWTRLTRAVRKEERVDARLHTLSSKYKRLRKRSDRVFKELRVLNRLIVKIDRKVAQWE